MSDAGAGGSSQENATNEEALRRLTHEELVAKCLSLEAKLSVKASKDNQDAPQLTKQINGALEEKYKQQRTRDVLTMDKQYRHVQRLQERILTKEAKSFAPCVV